MGYHTNCFYHPSVFAVEEQIFLTPESCQTIWYSNPALLAPWIIGYIYAENHQASRKGKVMKNSKTDLALKMTEAKAIHISKRPIGTFK